MGACWHRNKLNECRIIGFKEICPGEDPLICAAWMETEIPCPVCIMQSEGELRYLLENKYEESFFCEECDRKFSNKKLIIEYSTAIKFLAKVWTNMLDGMILIRNTTENLIRDAEVKF